MPISRNDNREIVVNDSEFYEETFEDRGVSYINQYTTAVLSHPNPQQINSLTVITHTWRLGDRLFKLAHKHYGDSRYWWIIAWYNLSPTDSHFSIGDTVQIPKPLPKVLRYLRIE